MSHRLGYLDGEKVAKLKEARQETARILQGFINIVEKQIQQGRIYN